MARGIAECTCKECGKNLRRSSTVTVLLPDYEEYKPRYVSVETTVADAFTRYSQPAGMLKERPP